MNKLGALIIVIGGILLLSSSLLSSSIIPVIITMFIATLGVGLVIPASIANAMSHIHHYAGQASSLIAFLQFGMAALTALIVGNIHFISAVPLGVMVLACGAFSAVMALRSK